MADASAAVTAFDPTTNPALLIQHFLRKMSNFDGHFPEDNYSERDQREAQRIFEQIIDAAELLGPLYVLVIG